MHTKTILTIFAIVTALGFIVTATSLATHASATRFGITLCSSLDTVGGKACLPTDKAPGPVGFTRWADTITKHPLLECNHSWGGCTGYCERPSNYQRNGWEQEQY